MARRPTQIGHAGAPLRLVPLAPTAGGAATSAPLIEQEDERTTVEQPPEPSPTSAGAPTASLGAARPAPAATRPPAAKAPAGDGTIDEHWDDGTTVDEATMAQAEPPGAQAGTGEVDGADEMTVDEPGRGMSEARLVVIAGNDTGREFVLAPTGKALSVGRAMDNDVVLTDIAVSRKHLDVVWEGGAWILKDRGSGNGTLLNDRIEDGACRLHHGDRIEIGHTVFRFDHPGSAPVGPPIAWSSSQQDDEASTVAGRMPPRQQAPEAAAAPRARTASQAPPPPPASSAAGPGGPAGADRKATLPPPRPKSPSQAPPPAPPGAVSSRLALPASPGTLVDEAARTSPAPRVAEPLVIAPIGPPDPMRQMTATAHVAPLSYGSASSGSLPPLGAVYGHPPLITSRRRSGLIAAAVGGGIAVIGIVAMLLGGDDPAAPGGTPPPSAAVADASRAGGTASALPAIAPDPAVKAPDGDPDGDPDQAPTPDDPDQAPTPDDPSGTTGTAAAAPDAGVEVAVKKPDPVVKKPDPVVKKPDPVVKKRPDPVVKKRPDPVVKKDPPKKATSADAAKKKAQALYASKDFKGAAAVLRDAAGTADAADAAALRRLAGDYDQLATSLAAGNAAAATKPTDALTAYKRALAADKKLGGAHASMIREKLGQVAPKAAAGFMAKGNYEAAKQAADTAVNFGAGSSPTVAQVRQSLERKAAELYASGMKILKSQPDEAKALFRRVLKIVPPDSPSYQKAYKAVNARTQARDDDE